jgi:hypothetical protein
MSNQYLQKDELLQIITNNSYLNKCKITNTDGTDPESLCYLIRNRINLTQSQKIKLGTALENLFSDIISKSNFTTIKPKNSKGKRELDHCWISADKELIIYAELKSNLNLDTEKSQSTIDKVKAIHAELRREYPEAEVRMYLVSLRYLNTRDISSSINTKYSKIREHLIGINDYLQEFGCAQFTDNSSYIDFITEASKFAFNL